MLTKRRASSEVQENAYAAMMRDLDDLEEETGDDLVTISCRVSSGGQGPPEARPLSGRAVSSQRGTLRADSAAARRGGRESASGT